MVLILTHYSINWLDITPLRALEGSSKNKSSIVPMDLKSEYVLVSKQIIVSVIDSQSNNVTINKDIILGVSIDGGVIVLGALSTALFFIIKKNQK